MYCKFLLHVFVVATLFLETLAHNSNPCEDEYTTSAETHFPRERYGIFYTGLDMELRASNITGKVNKSKKRKLKSHQHSQSQPPAVRYGIFYDDSLLKSETVIINM